MKKILSLVILSSFFALPSHAENATIYGTRLTAPGCGTSGQFLQSNGDCSYQWGTSSPSSLLSSTSTWTAQQTFSNQVTLSSSSLINDLRLYNGPDYYKFSFDGSYVRINLDGGSNVVSLSASDALYVTNIGLTMSNGQPFQCNLMRSPTGGQISMDDASGGLLITNVFGLGSKTIAQLKALAPVRAGEIRYCSDCATDAVCVSTGTGTGAWVRTSARGTVCQ